MFSRVELPGTSVRVVSTGLWQNCAKFRLALAQQAESVSYGFSGGVPSCGQPGVFAPPHNREMSLMILFATAALTPTMFWAWVAMTVGTGLGLGFGAGILFQNWLTATELRRRQKYVEQLTALLEYRLRSTVAVSEACLSHPAFQPSREQTVRLRQQTTALHGLLTQLQDRLPDTLLQEIVPFDPQKIRWKKSPVDPLTHLPDRQALDANMDLLQTLSKRARQSCGLILIRQDRQDLLRVRYGEADAACLWEKFAQVVCQSVRDVDFVCQFSADTLAVLLPQVTEANNTAVADQIRRTLRTYRFVLPDEQTEVLITGSLGCTLCPPDDRPGLSVNRATDALTRSERMGRNQLHLHNGQTVIHAGT